MRERGNHLLRSLDRQLGVPLVRCAGLLKRRRPLPATVRRIGIFKSTAIGDTVLLAAIADDLRAACPQARIVFFAGRDNASAAGLLDGVDEVVELPISRPWAAVRLLRRERVDLLLDFGAWPRIEAVLSCLSGARCTAGFRTRNQHRHYCYDVVVPHSEERHELDNYRKLVGAIGVETRSEPRVRAPGQLPAASAPEAPYAVFHLWPGGYRSELKEWPADRWRELAGQLGARGLRIVLTGGREDVGRTAAFVESCGIEVERPADLSGRLRIPELADLLAGSRCVVSVNTGVMHLAAAVGAPTIALNGPTSERRWGPVGERCRSVNSSLEGCGYLNLGFEYDGRRTDCMCGISVEAVLETALELIESGAGKSAAVAAGAAELSREHSR